MAITYLEIDTGSLDSEVREMEANLNRAWSSLEALHTEMEQLNAMWKGAANQAFRQQVNLDTATVSDMLDQVKKLSESMHNAAREYARCENEVIEAVKSIPV